MLTTSDLKTPFQQIVVTIRYSVLFPAIIFSVFLSGCAQDFYVSSPHTLSFDNGENAGDSLFVSYRKDVQYIMENNAYGDKEREQKVMCVALKITNKSNKTINLTPANFSIYGRSDDEKRIYSPDEYCGVIRQSTVIRLLNLPGYYFVFYPLIDLGKALDANRSNRLFQKQNKIWNKRIEPGASIFGVVCINTVGSEPLGFYFNAGLKTGLTRAELEGEYNPPFGAEGSNYTTFNVNFKDGRLITVEGDIRVENCSQYLYTSTHLKIRPEETQSIYRSPVGRTRPTLGIPRDHVWLFNVISGNVNAYNFNGKDHAIEFIQKETGEIVPFNPELLKMMTDGMEDELIYQQKYWNAIQHYNTAF